MAVRAVHRRTLRPLSLNGLQRSGCSPLLYIRMHSKFLRALILSSLHNRPEHLDVRPEHLHARAAAFFGFSLLRRAETLLYWGGLLRFVLNPSYIFSAGCLKCAFLIGKSIVAGGGARTHTALRPLDFESSASANSATPATRTLKLRNQKRSSSGSDAIAASMFPTAVALQRGRGATQSPTWATRIADPHFGQTTDDSCRWK